MKGLIIKDLYMTLKYCKMFFLIDIVFIVTAFLSADNTIFMMFPILFSGVIPITLLSYDERCGWNVYSGTLPYSKAQIVSAKYFMGLLLGILMSAAIFVVMMIRMGTLGEMDIAGTIANVCTMLAASFVFPALCLPFCFKFGTEKGRIVYFVVIFLVTSGAMSFINFDSGSFNFTGIISIIPAAIILLYIASWVISVSLFKGKNEVK